MVGASLIYAIDVDVAATEKKSSGIQLWSQLVKAHGEPETLRAQSGSGGYHYLFKANSPGVSRDKGNFSGLKVGKTTFGIDGRGCDGLLYAEPTSYIRGEGELASYQWINGPPSFDACKMMPEWLVDIVNRGGVAILEQAIPTCNANVSLDTDAKQTNVELKTRESADQSNDASMCSSSDNCAKASEMPAAISNTIALPGLQKTLVAIGEMMQKALAGDQSRFNGVGVRSSTGWQVLKFKTVGTRTCMNGCEHVSNNFSILCNGGVLLYRCFRFQGAC